MKKMMMFLFFVLTLQLYSEGFTEGNYWMVSFRDVNNKQMSPEHFTIEEVKFIKKSDQSMVMVFVSRAPDLVDSRIEKVIEKECSVRQGNENFIIEEKASTKLSLKNLDNVVVEEKVTINSTIYTGCFDQIRKKIIGRRIIIYPERSVDDETFFTLIKK